MKRDQNQSKRDQKRFKLEIEDTIATLKSESTLNRRWNLDGLESESSKIRFWTPNCLSLPRIKGITKLLVTGFTKYF